MAEENVVRQTLGKKLRKITEQAITNVEAQNLYALMEAEAEKGNSSIYFDDLRAVVPNMIRNETLMSWLASEEIKVSGVIDANTAAYKYTLSW